MKIAMVNNYSTPRADYTCGGLLVYAKKVSHEFTPVFIGKMPRRTLDWFVPYPDLKSVCKDFDFIIFTASWSYEPKLADMYRDMLKQCTKPFACQSQVEFDETQGAEQHDWYFKHKQFRLFLPCEADLWYNMPDVETYSYPCMPNHLEYHKTKKDPRLIISTSRLTSVKRIKEFVMQAPNLKRAGMKVQVHGHLAHPIYKRDLLQIFPRSWKYMGGYMPNEIANILGPANFHWGVRYRKRDLKHGRGIKDPRLEGVVTEAASFGCQLILQENHCPKELEPYVISINCEDPKLNLAYELKHKRGNPNKFAKVYNEIYADHHRKLIKKIKEVM